MALRLLVYGRNYLLNRMSGLVIAGNLQAELFQGNITPTQNDTNATYNSSLANFTGYAPVVLGAWSLAAPLGVQAQTTAPSCLFQVAPPASVPNQIYGYLIRNNDTGNILWAERFAGAPLSMTSVGDNIVLIPTLSEQSQFP